MAILGRRAYIFIYSIFTLLTTTHGQGPACTGQVIGEEFPDAAVTSAGPNSGTSYLLRDTSMAIPCCGVISEWRYVAKASGQVNAQVWNPVSGSTMSVIGENSIPGGIAGNIITHSVAATSQISVEQNHLIGWHSSGADVVGFESNLAYNQGVVSKSGQTSVGGSNLWSSTLVNGERWMFGATLSPNSPPTFSTLPTTVPAKVSDAVGSSLHTLIPTDTNPDDIAGLTVTVSPTSALFDVVGNDVQIKSTLTTGTHEVVLEVVDHCLETGTATLTVVVTDDPPEITSLPIAAFLLKEDTGIKTLLHTLVYTDDVDVTLVTCSISSTDPAAGAPYTLQFIENTMDYGIYFEPSAASPLDYDVTPLYSVFIVCNDGTQDSLVKEFQISVQPNEEPVPDIPATIDVTGETTANGTVVHTITATDTDSTDLIFTMDCPSPCPFAMLPNGDIYATEDLFSHRTSPYTATVNVSDGYNLVGPTDVTISITDINFPPNITNPTRSLPQFDTVYVDEHTDEGTPNLVGTVTSVYNLNGFDTDGDAITWDIQFYNGLDEQLFDYDNTTGEIFTKKDIDYEYLSDNGLLNTRAEIRAFDGREYSETRTLQIVVADVNETPVFNQDSYAIETVEGTADTVDLDCPFFEVTDEDNYDTRTYDINCGGVSQFSIPSTRQITCDAIIQQTGEYDLDSPGQRLDVVVCDITMYDKGGLSATTTLSITIHEDDDNWPVLDQTGYAYTITNDTGVGALFGNADATDDDFLEEHRRLTYTTDSSEFGVDENGVFVSKRDWTGVRAPTTRTFNLYVTDEAGHQDSAPVTIQIIDVLPITTQTTVVVVTSLPSIYSNINSFTDDSGNLAWLIPAILLGLAALGLMGFMCFRCCKAGGCAKSVGGRMSRFGGRMRQTGFARRVMGGRGGGRGGMVRGGMRGGMMRGGMVRRVEATPPRASFMHTGARPMMVRTAPAQQALPPPEAPPTVFKQPPPPTPEEPPKEKKSFWDRFKREPKPEPEPPAPQPREIAPKQIDDRKTWHVWNHTDFKSQQKWVG